MPLGTGRRRSLPPPILTARRSAPAGGAARAADPDRS
jgi:hypothetical protein